MKTMKLVLPLLTSFSLLACSVSESVQPGPDALNLNAVDVAGESIKPVVNEALTGYLVTSEAEGLFWLAPDASQLGYLSGHTAQADWRALPGSPETVLIAAIDNNTSALQLITLNTATGSFSKQLIVPAEIADRETICLSTQDQQLHLFSSDARGILSHYLVTSTPEWQLTPIRTLSVGPNLSACAVADNSNTVLLAEEETGIWHYSGAAEGEDSRQLDYFASGPEIESVSALSDGRYFVVATDEAQIYQRGQQSKVWQVEPDREFKSVSAATANGLLYLGLFDEASGQLLTTTLSDTTQPAPPKGSVYTVTADEQTAPVNRYGDAADDPAIWVNPQQPTDSLILGTDKKYGLNVYALDGRLLQSLPTGRVNNVDVRYNIATTDGPKDIAVASNRSFQTLSVYDITPTGEVSHRAELATTLSDVYGLCSGVINNQLQVFVNDTDGRYQQYALTFSSEQPDATLVAEFSLPSQPEGCVVDDANNMLYMGEEAAGVWQKDLASPLSEPELIATIGNDVAADIEGMGIYKLAEQRYLVASSQGNNRFAVFALDDDNRLLGTFKAGINEAAHIDGVSETDGLEVTATPLGSKYPEGLMVVQDGRNVMPAAPQNFKLISGSKLADFIRARR